MKPETAAIRNRQSAIDDAQDADTAWHRYKVAVAEERMVADMRAQDGEPHTPHHYRPPRYPPPPRRSTYASE